MEHSSMFVHTGTETQIAVFPSITYTTESAISAFNPPDRQCYQVHTFMHIITFFKCSKWSSKHLELANTQFIYSNCDVYIAIALFSKLLHSAIAI
jgi:hypothetical protein